MRYKVRNLVLAGLTSVLLAGCGGPATPNAGHPDFVEPSATPSVGGGAGVPPASSPASVSPPTTSAPTETETAKVTYAFPVIGSNSYGRTHHDYPATDIMASCGDRVVATTGGSIINVVREDTWSRKLNAGATRGGLAVAILGDDGVRYYGSHLSVVEASIRIGVRVKTGDTLGRIGKTGDASACHLHFGISPPCAKGSDWWNQRGVIWPWPYLDSWKKDGSKSAVAEIQAWTAKNGCPTRPRADP